MALSRTNVNSQVVISKNNQYTGLDTLSTLTPYALKDVNIFYSLPTAKTVDYTKLLVYGFAAINNMILNVVHTRIGERDFEPTFGSNALNLIHEPNDSVIAGQIEIELYDRIRFWVPYINIALSGIVCQTIPDEQAFALYFVYSERTTGIETTFNTYLSNRRRNY